MQPLTHSPRRGNILLWSMIIIAVIVLIIAFVAWIVPSAPTPAAQPDENGEEVTENDSDVLDMTTWNTYEDETYDFTMQYPPTWRVATGTDLAMTPMISIYDPTSLNADQKPPLIHHDNGVHVSIYPEGIPTEGIFGESATTTIEMGVELAHGRDFLLADGTPWASMLVPERTPDSWGQSGFLFAGTPIFDLDMYCRTTSGERIEIDNCDPMGAMPPLTVVREGRTDENIRSLERAILESFRFTRE